MSPSSHSLPSHEILDCSSHHIVMYNIIPLSLSLSLSPPHFIFKPVFGTERERVREVLFRKAPSWVTWQTAEGRKLRTPYSSSSLPSFTRYPPLSLSPPPRPVQDGGGWRPRRTPRARGRRHRRWFVRRKISLAQIAGIRISCGALALWLFFSILSLSLTLFLLSLFADDCGTWLILHCRIGRNERERERTNCNLTLGILWGARGEKKAFICWSLRGSQTVAELDGGNVAQNDWFSN